jgi:precorrin-4/cobalt-precorrin-4 C11-methyltransferase
LAGAAAAGGTLVLFLSIGHVRALVDELVDGPSRMSPETPAVAARRVSWPDEQVVHTTLADLVADVDAAGFDATTILLIGPALAVVAPPRRSHVYSASYTTRFRDADG